MDGKIIKDGFHLATVEGASRLGPDSQVFNVNRVTFSVPMMTLAHSGSLGDMELLDGTKLRDIMVVSWEQSSTSTAGMILTKAQLVGSEVIPSPHHVRGTLCEYSGNLEWLLPRTVLFVVHGSRAYGTSRPDSDYDFKGITIPPEKYRRGFVHRFEQADKGFKEDAVIYGIQKFFALAADCNPNIIELLWVDPSDIRFCSWQGHRLIQAREQFLSRKAAYTFRGYAMAQLKRIYTHRKWLLSPPTHQPTRAEFNLPERTVIPADQLAAATAEVTKKLDSWEIDYGPLDEAEKIHIQEQIGKYLAELLIGTDEKFLTAARLIGYDENFLVLLDRERHYSAALKNWQQYQNWRSSRNETRAGLEAQFGYDTKHGMHLVRLLRMCREILTEGKVFVRRPDAKELLAIRDGSWSFDRLVGWATEQDQELLAVEKTSTLPKSPNREALDQLCMEIIDSMPE